MIDDGINFLHASPGWLLNKNILVSKRRQVLVQKLVMLEDRSGLRQIDRNGLKSSSSCHQSNLPFQMKVFLSMYYSYSFWWPAWKSVVAAEVQCDNTTQMKERWKKVLFLKFWEDTHPLCTLHRHLAVDQGAPVRQPCGQARLCTPSTASESAAQSNQNRQNLYNVVFYSILSLLCSPLQIKTTNKNLTWAFKKLSRLCSTGCWEDTRKIHLTLCFLQAYKAWPEEQRPSLRNWDGWQRLPARLGWVRSSAQVQCLPAPSGLLSPRQN